MRLGESGHPVEHLVHLRDHIHAVDHERGALGHPQRDVQHGPVLGHVDPVAAEHRVPALGHPGLLGQLDQQPQRFVGDAVLGVVEVQSGRFGREALAAPRFIGEQLAQVNPGDLGVVLLERLPGGTLTERYGRHCSFLQVVVRPGPLSLGRCQVRAGAQPGEAPCALTLSSRSFQESTNDVAPSFCSLVASAAVSTPASAKRASSASQSPPSAGMGSPTSPWS